MSICSYIQVLFCRSFRAPRWCDVTCNLSTPLGYTDPMKTLFSIGPTCRRWLLAAATSLLAAAAALLATRRAITGLAAFVAGTALTGLSLRLTRRRTEQVDEAPPIADEPPAKHDSPERQSPTDGSTAAIAQDTGTHVDDPAPTPSEPPVTSNVEAPEPAESVPQPSQPEPATTSTLDFVALSTALVESDDPLVTPPASSRRLVSLPATSSFLAST